ncbi:hypothetical protein HanRHA438_Chr03g0135671 [Helianthus annuus]|nr:hypothetical protein HanRHA438_Chr03g0135671 [Helianthus annuus]
MARSTADAGRCRGFVAGCGRGQGGGRGQGVVTEKNMAATRELGNNKRTGQQQGMCSLGAKRWSNRSFGGFGEERVERGTRETTKKTRQLTTVNYGPAVIYGGPGFCIFLHRNTGCLGVKES